MGYAGGNITLCGQRRWGETDAWEKGKPGGCGGLSPMGPHLQLCLQASSLAQEWGHHVVSDGELVWNLCTAADQAWVDAIEVLVPKEAVLCPVFGHIL